MNLYYLNIKSCNATLRAHGVYIENVLKINDLTVEAGEFVTHSFVVSLTDGEFNIRFHDDGGSDVNWVVNAITIEEVT